MKTDETRLIDNNQSANYSAQDNTELNTGDTTILNSENAEDAQQEAPAPKAKKSAASTVASRAAYGAAGFVGGGIAGAGISAMASPEDKNLTKAATPDSEKSSEELAEAAVEPDPAVAPEVEDEEVKIIEEQAPATKPSDDSNAGEARLLNPETHSAPVSHSASAGHSDNIAAHTVTPEAQVEIPENVNINVNVTINGQTVQATPVTPEVEVHSVGTIMDAEGNIMNHAEVTVDGVNATLVDIDNNGTVDVAIVDADGDGIVSIDDAIDMTDTGLTMSDVSAHMQSPANMHPVDNDMALNDLAMNDTPDFDPGLDTGF